MYAHVLVAVDGSPYSLKAARHGLGVAKAIGAKVTAVYVTPSWNAIALSEIAIGHSEAQFDAQMKAVAAKTLGEVATMAGQVGVACTSVHMVGDPPYESIIKAAADNGCDLIVVGSHGRRGVAGLILGSQTTKLLSHSKLPVIVYRE
jgi:nucleotide-binding universal stress UspA family protein